jgi:hypothetical protein
MSYSFISFFHCSIFSFIFIFVFFIFFSRVFQTTYVHRLGRCTRSETASGLSINVLGGVEEATRDDPTKSARLLQQLKDSREPALEAFGPHYDVPRDIYRVKNG